jgi:hypothetical protein
MKLKKIFPVLILLISSFTQNSHAGNVYQKDWANSDKFVSVRNVGDKVLFQVCQRPDLPGYCETLGNPNGYSTKEVKHLQRKLRLQGVGLMGAYGAIVIAGAAIGGMAGITLAIKLVPMMSVTQFFTIFGVSFIGTTSGVVATRAFAEMHLNPAKKRTMAAVLANEKLDLYVDSIDKYLNDLENALSLLDRSEPAQKSMQMAMP